MPIAIDRPGVPVGQFGDLLLGQTQEVAELRHLLLLRIQFGKSLECLVYIKSGFLAHFASGYACNRVGIAACRRWQANVAKRDMVDGAVHLDRNQQHLYWSELMALFDVKSEPLYLYTDHVVADSESYKREMAERAQEEEQRRYEKELRRQERKNQRRLQNRPAPRPSKSRSSGVYLDDKAGMGAFWITAIISFFTIWAKGESLLVAAFLAFCIGGGGFLIGYVWRYLVAVAVVLVILWGAVMMLS